MRRRQLGSRVVQALAERPARRHSAISSVTYSSVSPSASSSAASERCSASASSVRPSERRHRATLQRAIRVLAGIVLALALDEGEREELERLLVGARVVLRPRHVVREGRDPALRGGVGRRAGELHRALVPLPRAARAARRFRACARRRPRGRPRPTRGRAPTRRGTTRLPRPSRARRVRDAAALEQDADAGAVVVGCREPLRRRRASDPRPRTGAGAPGRARSGSASPRRT